MINLRNTSSALIFCIMTTGFCDILGVSEKNSDKGVENEVVKQLKRVDFSYIFQTGQKLQETIVELQRLKNTSRTVARLEDIQADVNTLLETIIHLFQLMNREIPASKNSYRGGELALAQVLDVLEKVDMESLGKTASSEKNSSSRSGGNSDVTELLEKIRHSITELCRKIRILMNQGSGKSAEDVSSQNNLRHGGSQSHSNGKSQEDFDQNHDDRSGYSGGRRKHREDQSVLREELSSAECLWVQMEIYDLRNRGVDRDERRAFKKELAESRFEEIRKLLPF
ncbi:MAG: hypothetical protein LBB63_01580 [Holosporaceae bacterium]|jgi:hypothetical protein|nr:hypothetical protein [Holosporaceae bacterium]